MTSPPVPAGAGGPVTLTGVAVVRVLLCDDHAVFRHGVATLLEAEHDIDVVAQAGDAEAAIALAAALTPDVVLMDLRLPAMDGLEATRVIHDLVPTARVVVLTMSDDEHDLRTAMRAGAAGYLLKDIAPADLAPAVRATAAGRSMVSPWMASKLLTGASQPGRADARGDGGHPLSARELGVLALVARGMSNREIAVELFISEHTVKNHVRNVLEKLGLHSRIEAVMYAVRERILDPPDGADPRQ